MVTSVHYLATLDDQTMLLDYLGEPDKVTLNPWPVIRSPLQVLRRREALARAHIMVVNRELGPPEPVRPGDRAMDETTRSGVFNRLNWLRLRPDADEALVDSNVSPVLFWELGGLTNKVIRVSELGSQADAPAAVSEEYERWVNRTIGWIRRKGKKVWGLEQGAVRPDFDTKFGFVNSVYALPGALRALEHGAAGR